MIGLHEIDGGDHPFVTRFGKNVMDIKVCVRKVNTGDLSEGGYDIDATKDAYRIFHAMHAVHRIHRIRVGVSL